MFGSYLITRKRGGVAERTNAPVLKTGEPERVPEVRILSPPKVNNNWN